MSKVYAPTRMKNWVRCPIYAKLNSTKEPIADWTPNMLLGRALDAGMTLMYRSIFDLKGETGQRAMYASDLEERGLDMALETLREGYLENENWPLEGLEKVVEKTYAAALAEDVEGAGPIIAADESLGVGRPDLVQRSKDGSHLIVTDRKFRMKLEVAYLAKALAEYEHDDQFWHYAWEAEQRWGLPVEWLRVHLLIGTPKPKSILHPWRVTRERLNGLWLPSAEQNWADMEAEERGERPVVANWQNCMGKFGRCPYHSWCHEDPAQRPLFYRDREPLGFAPDSQG